MLVSAVGESSVILLTPPFSSPLKHLLKVEGGAAVVRSSTVVASLRVLLAGSSGLQSGEYGLLIGARVGNFGGEVRLRIIIIISLGDDFSTAN